MKEIPAIARAKYREVDAIADLVARAFVALDQVAWLVPDPARRRAVLAAQTRIIVEHALVFGEVDLFSDGSGVAVWFHRYRPIPPPPDYASRLADACGAYTDRFEALDKVLDANLPAEPHVHLAFLAVEPGLHRTGRGTALLRRQHARLDRTGIDAYLEAASPASRHLYLRHGYQVRSVMPLPNGSTVHGMWRPAAGDGERS